MKTLRHIPLSLALCLAAAPAALHAQAPEKTPGPAADEIVVTGTQKEVREELRSIFSETSDQLARVETEFCPLIMGFDAEYSAIIERRLRDNAARAGVTLGGATCKTNAVVIFVDEPQALGKALRREVPGYFADYSIHARDRLLNEDRPYYAWHATRIRGYNGETPVSTTGEAGALGTGDINVPVTRGGWPSRLSSRFLMDIATSFLLIDIDRTEGMKLDQIADFASLQLLLRLQGNAWKSARPDSILRLFDVEDPASIPARMNTFDRRMLNGTYAMANNAMRASIQSGRIAGYIKDGGEAEAGAADAAPAGD